MIIITSAARLQMGFRRTPDRRPRYPAEQEVVPAVREKLGASEAGLI